MIAPRLEKFINLSVALGPLRELGQGRGGKRRIIPIIGGTVSGELTGQILNIGADWQTVHSPELAHLDARYAFETDDGAVIEIHNCGFRHTTPEIGQKLATGQDVDPADYYFRTTATLETGDDRYAWVNTRVFVGTGCRQSDRVLIDLYTVE